MWKVVERKTFFWLAVPNILLAGQYPPEPEVESLPVEPAEEFETIQSPGYSQNQRGDRYKRSLPQDKTETLVS